MSFTFLDMFCGAGGSSWGAKSAGGTLVGAVDAWRLAIETIRENHPGATAVVRKLGPGSRPLKEFDQAVDLLLASPECTNHSPAKGAKPRDETSRNTANYVIQYAKQLRPRWIVVENVVQMKNWTGYGHLIRSLTRAGYNVSPQILDAADFGVPQTRRRLFLLCDREKQPDIVRPTHGPRLAAREAVQLDGPWPSKRLEDEKRAKATLERAKRGIEALGRGVPFLIVYYGSDGSGGWQSLDRPLRTLTTLDRFGLVTWRGDTPYLRMLQIEELKAAMGFPESYALPVGSRRDKIRMMGNGVCPPVMESIVRSLVAATIREHVLPDLKILDVTHQVGAESVLVP